MNKKAKSYFTEVFKVNAVFCTYIYDDLFRTLDSYSKTFGCHLVASFLNNLRNDQKTNNPIPVPFHIINKYFDRPLNNNSSIFWIELVAKGLIDFYVEDVEGHKCREFDFTEKVKLEILEKWNESILSEEENYVNLMTRKPCKKKPPISKLTNNQKNPYPYLVKKSLQVFNENHLYLNYAAPKEELKRYQMDWNKLDPKQQKRLTGFNTAYLNLISNGNMIDDIFNAYHPEYEVASSGRQFHKGVGPQGCPAEFKHLFYQGIPDIHNYDLKNSQMTILKQWFEDADISTNWIDTYLEKDKQIYADAVGISIKRWKRCINALCCGGGVLKRLNDEDILQDGKMITFYLMEEFNNDLDKVKNALYKFNAITNEFQANLEEWKDWLVEVHIKKRGVSSFSKGIHQITNGCGMPFNLSRYKTKNGDWNKGTLDELKRKLGAHWLQGDESAFIHTLVILSKEPEYGYTAWVNEHDGLVTQGSIPLKAIATAKKSTNLKYVELVEKPFDK